MSLKLEKIAAEREKARAEAARAAITDAASSLMEPVIMVVLGTLIGGMVVAMYLPIFKLGAVI